MAKMPMLCPFTQELCRECTVYRRRHYYICFQKEYRGYLGKESYMRKVAGEGKASVIIPRKKPR
jgi:hypothetical protein